MATQQRTYVSQAASGVPTGSAQEIWARQHGERFAESAGPMSESPDGTWAPGPPGPVSRPPHLTTPAERDAASSELAIGQRRQDAERRAVEAAQRELRGLAG